MLEPKFDGAKSFYSKASVERDSTLLYLRSYHVTVAVYDRKHKRIRFLPDAWYSRTTKRHVKEFCLQLGVLDPFNKANRKVFKEEFL